MSVPEGLRGSVWKAQFYKMRIHKNLHYAAIQESYLENLNKIEVMHNLRLQFPLPDIP